jgi:hypothetical protein
MGVVGAAELPRVAWEGLQEQRFATQLQKWPASIKQEHPHLHMDPSTGWASKFGSTHSVYNPSIARVGERVRARESSSLIWIWFGATGSFLVC